MPNRGRIIDRITLHRKEKIIGRLTVLAEKPTSSQEATSGPEFYINADIIEAKIQNSEVTDLDFTLILNYHLPECRHFWPWQRKIVCISGQLTEMQQQILKDHYLQNIGNPWAILYKDGLGTDYDSYQVLYHRRGPCQLDCYVMIQLDGFKSDYQIPKGGSLL